MLTRSIVRRLEEELRRLRALVGRHPRRNELPPEVREALHCCSVLTKARVDLLAFPWASKESQ
jgi:hypothetical protein